MSYFSLRKNRTRRVIWLAYEREGVFAIDRRTVKPSGFSEIARDRDGMSDTRFLRELRDRVSHLEMQEVN